MPTIAPTPDEEPLDRDRDDTLTLTDIECRLVQSGDRTRVLLPEREDRNQERRALMADAITYNGTIIEPNDLTNHTGDVRFYWKSGELGLYTAVELNP